MRAACSSRSDSGGRDGLHDRVPVTVRREGRAINDMPLSMTTTHAGG